MDYRFSQTPNHGDARNVILQFGSLKLGLDGNLEVGAAASQINNAAAAPTPQQAYGKSLFLPPNSLLDHGNLWGTNFLMTQGQEFEQNHNYADYTNHKPEALGCEFSSNQPTMEPLYTSEYVKNYPLFLENSSVGLAELYDDVECGFNALRNNVVYTGFDYGSRSSSPSGSSLMESGPRFDLSLLQDILQGGDFTEISMLLLTLQGSYLDMMTDKSLYLVFKRIVKACRRDHLDVVVADVLSCAQSFINAAFCKQGASSICKLIKRVKKSSHAFSIAYILSTQFLGIMTHEVARSVIQSCFNCFSQHNEVLYEKAILHCQELAMDKVGCRALHDVIEKIRGEQRSRLLKDIVDCSGELSNHQYGNYVVQKALSLKNESKVSAGIVIRLRGQFVELALMQGGSHVVEKCMEASLLGLVYVVKEIIETPKASLQLAQDQFGNYVIQKAFKKTKEHGLSKLYMGLMKCLEPYYKELNQTMSGKIVLALLKEEIGKDAAGLWRSKEKVLRL